MSKIKELYEKVAGDSGLQAKFAEIVKDAEKAGAAATKEKLDAFAKEAGFEVNMEEAQEYFKSLSEQKEGELSDLELDAVAGGKSITQVMTIVMSVGTVGVGCAVDTARKELGEKNTACDNF